MKKLILFLLLIPALAVGQGVRTPNLYLKGVTGKPINAPASVNDYAPNWNTNELWRGVSTTGTTKWVLETDTNVRKFFFNNGSGGGGGTPGADGVDATISVNSVNTVTGAPGSSASVVITDLNASPNIGNYKFDFTIPTGATGPTGPAGAPGTGGGTAITPYLIITNDCIVVAGYNATTTVTGAGINPAVYAGISPAITGADLFDWANLQYAMYLEQQSGKCVSLYGTFRGVNKMVDIGKYNMGLDLNGHLADIYTTGTGSFAVFGRPTPTDNSDALVMIAATYDIRNIKIHCASYNQTGLQPQPTERSNYTLITVFNAKTAIQLDFNIAVVVQSCEANTCTNGFMFDYGKWSGAGFSGAQSNMSYCLNSRCYTGAPFIADVGIGVYSSGSVTIQGCILEGYKYKRGIDVDGKGNTTSKDLMIDNLHFEPIAGTDTTGKGEAAIFIRFTGGVITIQNIKSHYSAVMIDAATQGGYLRINLKNVSWWVIPANGKFINNTNPTCCGIKWDFEGVEILTPTIMSGFAGITPVQTCPTDIGKICIH